MCDTINSESMNNDAQSPCPIERDEAFHRVSDVLKCKWALGVVDALSSGPARPSEIKRARPGLTDKVLTERLRMLEGYGLVEREVFAEVPPRVEYRLTPAGERLREAITALERVFEDHEG